MRLYICILVLVLSIKLRLDVAVYAFERNSNILNGAELYNLMAYRLNHSRLIVKTRRPLGGCFKGGVWRCQMYWMLRFMVH
jgi:hypothetical protein